MFKGITESEKPTPKPLITFIYSIDNNKLFLIFCIQEKKILNEIGALRMKVCLLFELHIKSRIHVIYVD